VDSRAGSALGLLPLPESVGERDRAGASVVAVPLGPRRRRVPWDPVLTPAEPLVFLGTSFRVLVPSFLRLGYATLPPLRLSTPAQETVPRRRAAESL